jgi:charged multivesicular body protein 7
VTSKPPTLLSYSQFMSSLTPIHAPGSYTYRFVGKPLYWALSQLNPFGSSSTTIEKEDVLWKRFGKGKEYVHISLLEVRDHRD